MSDLGEESSVHGQSRDGISGESALDLIDGRNLSLHIRECGFGGNLHIFDHYVNRLF